MKFIFIRKLTKKISQAKLQAKNKLISLTVFFRGYSIKQRIIISLLIISIFPITLVGLFSSQNYERSVTSKLRSYSGQLIHEVSLNVQNEVNQYDKLSETLLMDDSLQSIIPKYTNMSYGERNKTYSQLMNKFSIELFNYKNVQDISVWDGSGNNIFDMGFETYNQKDIQKILKATDDAQGNAYWSYIKTGSGRNFILLSRKIYYAGTYKKLGYLTIFIDEKIFSNDTYKDVNLGTGSTFYMMQDDGMILSSTLNNVTLGSKISDLSLVKRFFDNYKENIYSFDYKEKSGSYLYVSDYLPSLGWYIVGRVPYKYIETQTAGVKKSILVLCLIVILLSLIISFIIYFSIVIPLLSLLNYAKAVSNGQLDASLHDGGNDEFTILSQNIKLMVERLKFFIDEAVSQQAQKRKAELSMLQAQINPHFLFNTLNSLKWSAMLSGNKTLDEGIGALSALLQNTIINNKERIPFSAEIENVKNYAVIQRIRYADSFNLNFDIESGLENAIVLRFILQPIVENSIIHGNNSDERQITINVKAYSEDDNLKIVISDDGIGFSVEENSESKNKLSGIGITNVDERIRLNFGDDYGVTVKSKIGVGTTSYIKIPLIYKKEKKDV